MTQEQLGFGFEAMAEEQRTAYLPATMEEAIPFFRKLIERHNDAMLAGDLARTMAIRKEATDLAVKLNGGKLLGINGGPDSPVALLERATAAAPGTVPLWGQEGSFDIDLHGLKVRIEQDGLFGVGAHMSPYLGFGAHAVDYHRPFLSETGYRSFIGGGGASLAPGITPDQFAREMIKAYVAPECKGKLRRIERSYAQREEDRRAAKTTSTKAEVE